MRSLTALQNSLTLQISNSPKVHSKLSMKAKLGIIAISAGMIASGSALASCGPTSSINAGSILGAVVGGAVGHQLKGNQQTTATALGAAVGAMTGNSINNSGCNNNTLANDDSAWRQQQQQRQFEQQQYDRQQEQQQQQQRAQWENRQRQLLQQQQQYEQQRQPLQQNLANCQPEKSPLNIGTVLGAVVGGAVGHQVRGNQQTTATAVGAAVGAMTGNNLNERTNSNCVLVKPSQNNYQNNSNSYRNQGNPLSSVEVSRLDSGVAETMIKKQAWENSLESVLAASVSSNSGTKLGKSRIASLSENETMLRSDYTRSRDELIIVMDGVANRGNRDISRYSPALTAFLQIPTDGVVSVRAIAEQERILRQNPDYNRLYNQVNAQVNSENGVAMRRASNVSL